MIVLLLLSFFFKYEGRAQVVLTSDSFIQVVKNNYISDSVHYVWPVAVSGASEQVLRKINYSIQKTFCEDTVLALKNTKVIYQTLTDTFFQRYGEMQLEDTTNRPDYKGYNGMGFVNFYNNNGIISMLIYNDIVQSGAIHGYEIIKALNIDSYTGNVLPGCKEQMGAQFKAFARLEKMYLYTQYKEQLWNSDKVLNFSKGINEPDTFFTNSMYKLEYLITPLGLQFFYQSYQMGAYVYGHFEHIIPWDQIFPLLLPQAILRRVKP